MHVVRMNYRRRPAVQLIHVLAAPACIDVLTAALQLGYDSVEVLLHLPQVLVGIHTLRQVVAVPTEQIGDVRQCRFEALHAKSPYLKAAIEPSSCQEGP